MALRLGISLRTAGVSLRKWRRMALCRIKGHENRRKIMGIINSGRTSVAKWAGVLALTMGTLGFGQASAEQAYPSKPIQFVVPYAPGGPLDNVARLLAEKVQPDLGQTVIVENRPGAGGNIGAAYVAKAAPDGYTLVMGAVAINAINPWLYPDIPFDPVKSFAPVALL